MNDDNRHCRRQLRKPLLDRRHSFRPSSHERQAVANQWSQPLRRRRHIRVRQNRDDPVDRRMSQKRPERPQQDGHLAQQSILLRVAGAGADATAPATTMTPTSRREDMHQLIDVIERNTLDTRRLAVTT